MIMITPEFVGILAAAIAGGITAYIVSVHLGRGGVLGSAVVVLASGLVFPALFGDLGTQLALAATTASYAGMVSGEKCGGILPMTAISIMAGTLFAVSDSVYPGVGGRLGTIAAISCLSFIGYRALLSEVIVPSHRREGEANFNQGDAD